MKLVSQIGKHQIMDGSPGAEIAQRPEIIGPVATVWLDLAVFTQSSTNIGIFA